MSDQTPQLFEVQIRVRTTREHPNYAEVEFGRLFCWFFGVDEMSAYKKAMEFAVSLPYKLGDAKILPVEGREDIQPWQVDCAVQAYATGDHVEKFIGYKRGLDEDKILGHWPYLVPPLKM